jgi:hypothetical protein
MEEPTHETTAEPFSAIRCQISTFSLNVAIKALMRWVFFGNWQITGFLVVVGCMDFLVKMGVFLGASMRHLWA